MGKNQRDEKMEQIPLRDFIPQPEYGRAREQIQLKKLEELSTYERVIVSRRIYKLEYVETRDPKWLEDQISDKMTNLPMRDNCGYTLCNGACGPRTHKFRPSEYLPLQDPIKLSNLESQMYLWLSRMEEEPVEEDMDYKSQMDYTDYWSANLNPYGWGPVEEVIEEKPELVDAVSFYLYNMQKPEVITLE